MIKSYYLKMVFFLIGILGILSGVTAQNFTNNYNKYLPPSDLNQALAGLNKSFPGNTKVLTLAVSPGKKELKMIEIGPETGKTTKTVPSVLVVANMEGTVPLSSMAALYLADLVLHTSGAASQLTWYILPCGNPDAYQHYFEKPLKMDPRNDKPRNDDMDDQNAEDGTDDLDKNGIITQMRVKDPKGTWITVSGDPRMLRKAILQKGEKGVYKLYTEGIDNDRDGKYNEDGPGGINPGINFPHLFKPFQPTTGLWPGCTDESFQLMKFVMGHPEIAMTMTYGATNFCMVPPKGGRRATADMNKIKIPKDMASMINADPNRTYTMQEIMDLVKPMMPPGMEVSENMIAGFLGLGAVVNPLSEDLKFYKELSDNYKDFLKEKGLKTERLDPTPAKDGSFELWSYYQVGVPTFSMDFWTLPKIKEEKKSKSEITPESLEKMTSDEFIALGEEKIDVFLKASGAPAQFKGKAVIQMMKDGKMTPKRMAEMMKKMPKPKDEKGGDPKTKALLAFSDKQLNGAGFIDWQPYKHPVLGNIEIGGAVPFVSNTPPEKKMDSLLSIQVPWILKLTKKLPKLDILKSKVTNKGGGVYEVSVWVENKSYLPFPTAMGRRDLRPAPGVVIFNPQGATLLSGKKRTPVQSLKGFGNRKITWLVQTDKTINANIKLTSANAWGAEKQIKIGGAK